MPFEIPNRAFEKRNVVTHVTEAGITESTENSTDSARPVIVVDVCAVTFAFQRLIGVGVPIGMVIRA